MIESLLARFVIPSLAWLVRGVDKGRVFFSDASSFFVAWDVQCEITRECDPPHIFLVKERSHGYRLGQNNYSFDALWAYCFGINMEL